jgi:hypothetical protein
MRQSVLFQSNSTDRRWLAKDAAAILLAALQTYDLGAAADRATASGAR